MRPSLPVILAGAFAPMVLGVPGVLSPLPPMGYNNWAAVMGGLNQSLFTETADLMIEKGLLQAGYNRINLDDNWSKMSRRANGSMEWDEKKFPKGLAWLASELKSKGFTPGLYTDAGLKSCSGYPGAYGHEEIDAEDFYRWGFEYLKLDGCNMPDTSEKTYKRVYGKWHEILNRYPNPMVFSESAPAYFAEALNATPWYEVMNWVPQYGQLARHSRDSLVFNSTLYWPNITGWDSVMFNYGMEVRLGRFQRPGYFNDPDFLNVDHFDYTLDERKSHFALWASFSAPLIISTNVKTLKNEEVEYLTNKDIIDIDQDPLVQQASLVSQSPQWDVLTKSLYNGDRLLTVLNKGNHTADLFVPFSRIGLSPSTLPTPSQFNVKDLWTGKTETVRLRSGGIRASKVPKRGTAVFRISDKTPGDSVRTLPTGQIFNTFSLDCLTDVKHKGGNVKWAQCTGNDSQVWRVRPDGTISSLAHEDRCLTQKGSKAITTTCGTSKGIWAYFISGNIVNVSDNGCLTQRGSKRGLATVEHCGNMRNEQVMAVPVGVTL